MGETNGHTRIFEKWVEGAFKQLENHERKIDDLQKHIDKKIDTLKSDVDDDFDSVHEKLNDMKSAFDSYKLVVQQRFETEGDKYGTAIGKVSKRLNNLKWRIIVYASIASGGGVGAAKMLSAFFGGG